MHRTKRAARTEAWGDSSNPFAKHTRVRRRGTDASKADLAERGLHDSRTDDPEYRLGMQNPQYEMSGSQQTSAAHAEQSGASRKRNIETTNEHSKPLEHSPISSMHDAPSSTDTKVERVELDEKSAAEQSATGLQSSQIRTGSNMKDGNEEKKGIFGKLFKGKKRADTEKSDDGKPKKKFTFMSQVHATLLNSWINILLIASPVGIALYYAGVSPVVVFVVNFIAIIPLAALLSYATEEIALRTGEVIGGLLNASFGNAVELIVSIIALAKDQIIIVQTSLIGSILSNLLLVMGMCFFAGGVNRIEQAFNLTVAQTASSLLFLAVSSLIIPTAFDAWANTSTSDASGGTETLAERVDMLSRATAILLLLVYGCYLFFQLKSHSTIYNASGEKNQKRDMSSAKNKMKYLVPGKLRKRSVTSQQSDQDRNDNIEQEQEPELHIWVAIGTLAAATVLVAFNAEYLVDSINAITCGGKVSKTFVGLILLPIVGNAAEHATAVTVAIKDKMDLAIGVAVGSSMQIALLVLPLMVVLGWIMGKNDMTLLFDGFQIATLFVAVLLVNYLIQDGKSHWLEGVLLMTLYTIIAVAAWFYPPAAGLSECGE